MPSFSAPAQRHRPSASAGIVRRIVAVLSVGLLAVIGLVAVPTAAVAAQNTDVVISDVTLVKSEGASAGAVKIGDILTVRGNWSAVDAAPQAGQSFTVTLPKELGLTTSLAFPLTGEDSSGQQHTWATCETVQSTGVMTCTFTEAVTANPLDVQGTFGFEVKALRETTEKALAFDLNGTKTLIDIPGGEGIVDPTPIPTDWKKSGRLNADKRSLTWTIELPGASLVGKDAISVGDALSDNHVLCEPTGLKVEAVRTSGTSDISSIGEIVDGDSAQNFSIALTAPEAGFDAKTTYRVTYKTCTPDGQIDPKGTEYTNEATFLGASSGEIGVIQDWQINPRVAKSGSVLGGEDRNGVIRWTVTVPGDLVAGAGSFVIADGVTGAHEITAATIDSIRVVERYGPDGSGTDITKNLTFSTIELSATAFTVRASTADGSDFAFKPSDHMYLITYDTFSTTDGLPAAGTEFANAVSIDGSTASASTKAPGRSAGKWAKVNDTRITLNGVEHLPQTTLGWTIRIPGEKLADLDGPLVLTDTLSEMHEVCVGESDDVAKRLGLDVEARDQIGGGGLGIVDITDKTTATVDGNVVTFTIDQPTLAIPGGTSATGFSREYEYVLNYATCTTSRGMDAKGTEYSNTVTGHGLSYFQRTTQNNSGWGTGQGTSRGSVAVSKTLADTPGAEFVPAGTTFTVKVQEIDPKGVQQAEYTLQVPVNGDPVSGLNPRGKGWTIQLSEPTFPSVPGVTWGAPVFQATTGVTPSADGTTAVAALTPGSNIAVSLENRALLGSVAVTKNLTGPDAAVDLVDADQTYRVTAKIDTSKLGKDFPAQPDRVFDLTAGATETLNDLPIGAVVTVTEAQPGDDDLLTWSTPVISPNPLTVTAEHATTPAAVTVTNHVERTVGTFSIVKSVTGAQAENPAVPESVTVSATWTQDGVEGTKTLTVPTDGTPVDLGENLLIGTKVTLTETPLVDGSSIAWAAPVWSGTGVATDGLSAVVSIGRDAEAQVSLQNHAATSVAGISLIKGIAGAAAAEVAADTEFPVTATWTDAEGKTQSKEITINAVEPTPLGVDLPAGTVVTITEGESPAFDTVVWGSITISGDDVTDQGDGVAEIIVSDQQGDNTLVTVVNEATWAPGTFTLSKDVAGILLDNTDVPETVTVTASWLEGDEVISAEVTLPTDGTAVPFGQDLPHGTAVTLSELSLDEAAAFTWNTPVWSGDDIEAYEDGTAVLTIGAAKDAAVTVTNTATAKLGSLAVTKTLTGTGAGLVEDAAFPIVATWTDLLGKSHQAELEVRAGEPTVIENLPLGTEVTLTENAADVPANARWHGATWSSADESVALAEADGNTIMLVVSGVNGATADIEVANEFEKLPDLAVTGGPLIKSSVVILAVLLMGVGILMLVLHRRQRRA